MSKMCAVNYFGVTDFQYLVENGCAMHSRHLIAMQTAMAQMSVQSASSGIELFSIAPIPNPALLDT